MSLLCQRDSYLQSVQTTITSATVTDDTITVVLAENVLFPEGALCFCVCVCGCFVSLLPRALIHGLVHTGGGQPEDHGWINDLFVEHVQHDLADSSIVLCSIPRKGLEAVPAWQQGDAVTVRVDWERRWDHMQQVQDNSTSVPLFSRLFTSGVCSTRGNTSSQPSLTRSMA